MTESGKTAFITGGASGIGKAVAQMLFSKGCNVFIADYNIQGASALVAELNKKSEQGISENKAEAGQLDVTDWNQQVQAFEKAITAFGRIDYVYPIAGIGEKAWIKNDLDSKGFEAPDLTCLDVDLKAVLYTCSLAIQHFRRQEPNNHGFRGKITCVSSICGFYCVPTLPIYTSAKHGVLGFVRSYGQYLAPTESITLNAICPNVVRTAISSSQFYSVLESKDLLTPMESLLAVFESLLGADTKSGEVFEVGPRGTTGRGPVEPMDDETGVILGLLEERGRSLQTGS